MAQWIQNTVQTSLEYWIAQLVILPLAKVGKSINEQSLPKDFGSSDTYERGGTRLWPAQAVLVFPSACAQALCLKSLHCPGAQIPNSSGASSPDQEHHLHVTGDCKVPKCERQFPFSLYLLQKGFIIFRSKND